MFENHVTSFPAACHQDLVSFSMAVSGDIDWALCIICQRETLEELRCPRRDHLKVYNSFIKNVKEFKKIDLLSVSMHFPEEGSVLMENQAKWHKQCHQKFNNAGLDRAKQKRDTDGPSTKRRLTDRSKPDGSKPDGSKQLCIFCGAGAATSEALHEFTTFNANRSVSQMATEMCDTALLTKLAEGDLVAIEAKYHFNCLSRYRNQYRGYL